MPCGAVPPSDINIWWVPASRVSTSSNDGAGVACIGHVGEVAAKVDEHLFLLPQVHMCLPPCDCRSKCSEDVSLNAWIMADLVFLQLVLSHCLLCAEAAGMIKELIISCVAPVWL